MIQQWLLKNNYILFPAILVILLLSCAGTKPDVSTPDMAEDSSPVAAELVAEPINLFVGEWVGVGSISWDKGREIRTERKIKLGVYPDGRGYLCLGRHSFGWGTIAEKRWEFCDTPRVFFSTNRNKWCLVITTYRENGGVYYTVFHLQDQNHLLIDKYSLGLTEFGAVILEKTTRQKQ
jgi:hypothetical protein